MEIGKIIKKVQLHKTPSKSCNVSKQELALRSKYKSIEDFCTAYNPDMQLSLCKDSAKCFFADYPTLALLQNTYKVSSSYWLVPQLVNLSQFCGAGNKLQGRPLEECAELIAQNYYYLKISEVMLFFYRFKLGRYGRFYGSIDPIIIMQAMDEFVTYDRCRAIEDHENMLRAQREKEESKRAVTYEEYLTMKDKLSKKKQ